jgi:hypothetical protein
VSRKTVPFTQNKRLRAFVKDPPYSIFSDPVWSYSFSGATTATGIADYVIRISLGDEKAREIGRVVRVDPQHSYKIPGRRGSRVDIRCYSENGYVILIELQFSPDDSLTSRNLLATSHIVAESAMEGVDGSELRYSMPIVVCIDFVNDIVRHSNTDCVQPARVSFEKPPAEVAAENWSVYYVQIPRFLSREPDFDDPLDCFLYAACQSHEKHLTMREVIDMTEQLQAHERAYPGFGALADRHANAAADPEVRRQHDLWILAELKYIGEMNTAINRAVKSAVAEKDAELSSAHAEIARLKALLEEKQ